MKMKEAAKVLLAFGILGTILFFFIGADGGPFWSWILFFVFAIMLVIGICLNSAARKQEQQNTTSTNQLAQAQGALAEREALIAKMRANGMSDEDIQKYLH